MPTDKMWWGHGRCQGKACMSLGMPPSQLFNEVTNLEVLWTPSFKVSFNNGWLTKSLATGELQVNSISRLSILKGGRGQWKFQSSNHDLSSWWLAPIWSYLGASQSSVFSLAYERYLSFWRLPRVLGVVCQEPQTKTNISFTTPLQLGNRLERSLSIFCIEDIMKKGKVHPHGEIRITWWMGTDKVQLD